MSLVTLQRRSRSLRGLGDSRISGQQWLCSYMAGYAPASVYVGDFDKAWYEAQGARCIPIGTPPAPAAPAPVATAPVSVIQTVTQTPVQNQSSGQDTTVGSNKSGTTSPSAGGVTADALSAILASLRTPSTPAATPVVSVSSGSTPVVESPIEFLERNKYLIAGLIGAMGLLYYLKNKK